MANNNADKINCRNVINLRNLSRYLREFNNGVHLSVEEMDKIYYKLMSANGHITKEEHVQNIRQTQANINKRICPRCGGELVFRNGKNGPFYGCSNYPKCKFTKNIR